ncbi:PREDICTED: diffuse panbronchiolitis critical region protein 1 [Condylura cristata]|uniref:diffuse panbronchiolitis critical region protein 1 n=1 Tax=Condylura cristata TaxID=143302 RepID=UPI000643419B|nr:PREDICTED: diffuse panbronchiolitis critical region protein 1 [Condylura cristata]
MNTGTSEKHTAYTKNISSNPKTTSIPTGSTKKTKNITVTTETIKTSVKSMKTPARYTGTTQTVRPAVKVTGDKPVHATSPNPNKTKITHQVLTGSFTFTTSTTDSMSHSYKNKGGIQGGLHAGVIGANNSFPAWDIVIVVLLAVILLLVFLGVIFLVSYMTRRRQAQIQTPHDNDSEDEHGPNSYPVYLIEKQTLGMGQIPTPQ